MSSTGHSDDSNPVPPLHYARSVPALGSNDDAREVIGCLLAWLVLVSGLVTGMAWLYWSAIHKL